MKKIVLATHNKDKAREMREALTGSGWELVAAFDLPGVPEVVEDGATLEENSFKKADALRRFSGWSALADDTGLFVDALNGEPGIFAARYAGDHCTYSDNVRKLLKAMAGVPAPDRGAVFRTVITILHPDGGKDQVIGEVRGAIEEVERGSTGFGYDPVFRPVGSDKVFAEMSLEEKNRISHRGLALQKALEALKGRK
ncbi:MAG TPA: RdgB/HAM1 family non-canonical purine NTP pyrophosphatase [bacterium]|nr:RdgB/HAM1 family non-canonical purine NTP pyrophosphatase [bacterium]